jgi:hypothetical protein
MYSLSLYMATLVRGVSLEHIPKKLNDFFDKNMLKSYDFARILFDRTDSVRSESALSAFVIMLLTALVTPVTAGGLSSWGTENAPVWPVPGQADPAPSSTDNLMKGAGFSTALTAGTDGGGVEIGYRAAPGFGTRMRVTRMRFSASRTLDQIPFHITPDLFSVTSLVDWYPWSSGFRASTGLRAGRNRISLFAKTADKGSVHINGTDYSSSQVQSVSATVNLATPMAVVLLGYETPLSSSSSFFLGMDAGMGFAGTPAFSLAAQTSPALASSPALAQDLKRTHDAIKSKINWLKYMPIISLSLGGHF